MRYPGNPFDHWPLRRWSQRWVAYRWDCFWDGHVWRRAHYEDECIECGKRRAGGVA